MWRAAFTCCKFGAAVVVLAVIAAGILTVRLQQGPIQIEGLGDKIAGALQQRFGRGAHFVLGNASLVQRGFGPTLAIDRLSVSGPDGQPILTAPKAEVSIDPFALMVGKVLPRRLEVFDVTLRLALLRNGSLALAAGDASKPFFELDRAAGDPPVTATPDAPAHDSAPDPQRPPASHLTGDTPPASQADKPAISRRAIVMRQAGAAIRQFLDVLTDPKSAIAAVDRLGIARGTLVIEDQINKDEVVYKDLDLKFEKAHGATNFDLSAEGPNGRWTVAATASGSPGSDRRFKLRAAGLSIDELQLAAGSRSLGVETNMPIGLNLDLAMTSDNTLSMAAGGVTMGPGFYRLDDPDQEPVFVDDIRAKLHWNGAARHIEIDPVDYVAGTTHLKMAGSIAPPLNEGEAWQVRMATAGPGVLGPDRKGQEPVAIDEVALDGRLELDQKRFDIDRFSLRSGTAGLALAGVVDWVSGPHIRIGASIDPTPVPIVQRLWPAFMAAQVRAWLITHFTGGIVSKATMKIDYHGDDLKRMRADLAPADQSVDLDFTLKDGSLILLNGVPEITHGAGHGHVTGHTTHFDLTSGTIDADGQTLAITNGLFAVNDSDVHPTPALVVADLSGRVEAVTSLLSRPALKPYASIPLDPTTLHGRIEGHLEKDVLLGPGTDSAHEALRVNAKVTNFAAERLIGKEGIEDGVVSIVVDAGTLKANGQARLFGGPGTFEITRAGLGVPNAVFTVTLDDAARGKLGMPATPGLSGPLTARVNVALGDVSKIKAQVDLDLTKTAITAAYLGLSKPAGKPAKISFATVPNENKMMLEPLTIDVGALQARGTVELDAGNGFQAARFSSFKVSPGDDMKLDVGKSDDMFKLTIRGSTIDARPFIKALTTTPTNEANAVSRSAKAEKAEADSFKGFDIDLKSGLLTGFNKEVMSGVDLKLSRRGTQIRQFSAQGRFGRNAVYGSMDASQKVKIFTKDAGALVSFVDLYQHMEGGDLDAKMTLGEETLEGYLEIRDFILRDEPALRSLVARSATVSAPGQDEDAARRINSAAVDFKRLKVNFSRQGSRLELKDATMYGPEIGLSVDGWLDYSHNQVAMNGTFVPAYAINNLFSQIPVFGVFLGGKSNEGLLAITFKISGLASSPTLSINPLSAITPGFLRNIFGILENPNGEQQPSYPSR